MTPQHEPEKYVKNEVVFEREMGHVCLLTLEVVELQYVSFFFYLFYMRTYTEYIIL